MDTVERVVRGGYNYYHQKSRVETSDGKAEIGTIGICRKRK